MAHCTGVGEESSVNAVVSGISGGDSVSIVVVGGIGSGSTVSGEVW